MCRWHSPAGPGAVGVVGPNAVVMLSAWPLRAFGMAGAVPGISEAAWGIGLGARCGGAAYSGTLLAGWRGRRRAGLGAGAAGDMASVGWRGREWAALGSGIVSIAVVGHVRLAGMRGGWRCDAGGHGQTGLSRDVEAWPAGGRAKIAVDGDGFFRCRRACCAERRMAAAMMLPVSRGSRKRTSLAGWMLTSTRSGARSI